MIGKKINGLLIIGLDEIRNQQLKLERKQGLRKNAPICYLFECDCGNIISLEKSKILKRKSIGCKECNRIKFDEYIGKEINDWYIIRLLKNNKFECKCKCGNVKEVNCYNVVHGSSKDCGCGRKESLSETRKKDIIGNKYGKLTVVEECGKTSYGKLLYRCLCDCGKTCVVTSNSLYSEHTTSCGCLTSSKGVFEIKKVLNRYNIKYETEKTMDGMCYLSSLRFDFFIEEFNIAIEFDGEQHFKPIEWFGGTEAYEKTVIRDKIKDEYCKDNDIVLIRIPYYLEKDIKNIIVEKIIKKYYAERLNEENTYKK